MNISSFLYQCYCLSVGPGPLMTAPKTRSYLPLVILTIRLQCIAILKSPTKKSLCYNKVHVPQQNQYQEAGH